MAAEKPTVIDDKPEEKAPEVSLEKAPEVKRPEEYIRFNSGDSLEALAEKYETTVEAIIERNKINPHPTALQVGHWLYV